MMLPNDIQEIGFIRYDGKAVSDGIIDAGNAGMALIGLDETIRYFNEKQDPSLTDIEYQLPIQVTNTSWKVFILLAALGSPFAIAYLKKAGELMAQNDFKNIGFRVILQKSLEAMRKLVELCIHTKKKKNWDLKNVKWRNNNTEVGILNESGEPYFVPQEYIEWYQSIPISVLTKMIYPIEHERKLTIGVKKDGKYEEVTLTEKDKYIFIEDDADIDYGYVLPELKHGDPVTIEGKVTRGNESTNSVGLEYKGHILNCIPEQGSIRRFKNALFLRCSVDGIVNRYTKNKAIEEKKPTIVIRSINPLEKDEQQTSVF